MLHDLTGVEVLALARNPVPGATPRERIASLESSWKYVKSMPKSIAEHPRLEPELVPSTRSGFRLGLPMVGREDADAVRAGDRRERLQCGVQRRLLSRAAVRARGAAGY